MKFTEVKVKDLEGRELGFDISKNFGNLIYQRTGDLGMLDVAQKIYKAEDVELTDEQKKHLIELLKDSPFVAMLKKQLIEMLS